MGGCQYDYAHTNFTFLFLYAGADERKGEFTWREFFKPARLTESQGRNFL